MTATQAQSRTIAQVIPSLGAMEGGGVAIRRAFPNPRLDSVDPFLLLDHFGPNQIEPGDSTGFPDQPPVKSGAAICDFMAGIHLYAAIMTALYERERTGRGRVVEVSMQDATYASLASNLGMLHARGAAAPARTGNRHGGLGISPYNAYPTTDGYVVLNAPGDHHFRSILDVMGRPDLKEDPRFLNRASRVTHFADVDALIEGWTKTLSRNEVAQRMLAAKVPCAPVRDLAEVMHDENMHARGSLQCVDHPDLGRVVLPHSPLVFAGTQRRPIEPSLPLGGSNQAIFGDWLGHSETELAAFRAKGVIGTSDRDSPPPGTDRAKPTPAQPEIPLRDGI